MHAFNRKIRSSQLMVCICGCRIRLHILPCLARRGGRMASSSSSSGGGGGGGDSGRASSSEPGVRAGERASGAVPRESRQASRRCRWVSAVDRSPAARNDAGVSLMLFVVTDRASRIRRRPGRAGPRAGCTVPARARLGCTASDPRRQSIGRRRHPLLRCKSTAVACCSC